MPILVTRHGMVDYSNMHLDAEGQKYADNLPDLVEKIDSNYSKNSLGGYANDIAASDGYQRCVETIKPLVNAAGYSVGTFDGNGPDIFNDWKTDSRVQGSDWMVLCLRIGGINIVRESEGLSRWTSAQAYASYMVFNFANGVWSCTEYPTGQSATVDIDSVESDLDI